MRWLGILLLTTAIASAQQPQRVPTNEEMQAIINAFAKQRDNAQSLHAQCEMSGAQLQAEIAKLTAEVKVLKAKYEPEKEPKK